jgi:hypothetical protein
MTRAETITTPRRRWRSAPVALALGALITLAGAGRAEEPAAAPLSARAPATAAVAPGDQDFATLCRWLTGSFTSAAQAEADTAFLDIHLQMVRIWPERSDACWLYVEQALGTTPERPYRQRVYRVAPLAANLYESAVFTLPDPAAAVGAWRQERPLSHLAPDDLSRRDGCAVLLRRDARTGEFFGGTVGRSCGSDLGDAAYAASKIRLGPDMLASWDRGFDAEGAQVWGAQTGPYVFRRR